MTIAMGTRIGAYEISAAIGSGGMGEVYRARDGRLGRDVALKVLPETFARDAERMARFQREAKILASLNHPNIAAIYGFEDSNGAHALVMELAEGPTLADRIKAGPIPIDDALHIARQICDALEYAHEKGIIHRDLKPANVKASANDTVKILDFGLAKALESGPPAEDIANSPTISRMATQAGVLLGTAAYMSPEQAKAKPVDRRTDIWAFGCVLYEMLTGQKAFHGETVAEMLAAIIRAEPDWELLPAETPVRVRVLLQRCLQKDPKQRLRDAGDAGISLNEVLSGAPEPSPVGAIPRAKPFWRRALPWAIAFIGAMAAIALAFVHFRQAPLGPAERVSLQIVPTAKTTSLGSFALSPDGRQLAFFGVGSDGVQRLWLRRMDSPEAHPLNDSEGAYSIPPPFFWSPDGRYIVFDAGAKLRKLDVSSGVVETLWNSSGRTVVGGSWSREGDIIYGLDGAVGIMRISANGGNASPVTALDSSRGDMAHDFPSFLPDGRHFIYLRTSNKPENNGLYIGSLDAKPADQSSRLLVATKYGAAYVPAPHSDSGNILFCREGTLFVQAFNARRLELVGEPVPVTSGVGAFREYAFFSVSTNGVLVYRASSTHESELVWFDRQGKSIGSSGESSAVVLGLSVSPDGTKAIVSRFDQNPNLWLVDLLRGTSTRFTFGPSVSISGTWSPDGDNVIFASDRDGTMNLYRKPANGVEEADLLLKSGQTKMPTSASRDGRFLLYDVLTSQSKRDIWMLPLVGEKKPVPFLQTEFNESFAQFSPDGRWVAYQSDESGRYEIYVRTFSPALGGGTLDVRGEWLVSTSGGTAPRWSRDGRQLYYISADGELMTVDVATNPAFHAGVPQALFRVPALGGNSTELVSWDVAPDGKRFLFPTSAGQDNMPFAVLLNWQAGLKK